MDDDDDTRTLSRSPTPSPPPNAAPPQPTLTLALPSRHPRRAAAAAAAAAGGREEFWSEGATWTLIDAWGERFVELSRGSLKQKQWQEVADAVNRAAGAGFPKSDAQCKNRIDTLKKKYKVEKTKIASSWPFFRRLDDLLAKPSSAGQFYILPHCNRKKRTSKKKSHRQLLQALKPVAPQWPESSDSFRPAKKRRSGKKPVAKAKAVAEEANKGVKQLTTAIVRLGEIYERVERSRLRQTAELEKQRMAFAKELELQRMQFFIKTQLEITQLKQCHGNNNNNDNHSDADNDS